jgi:glucose-1-phosphate thymidylyltransferase
MLEKGARMRTREVDVWMDAGVPAELLETNRHLLTNFYYNSNEIQIWPDLAILPPVYIHPSAKVTSSVIGPNVSVGKNCVIDRAIISDSILEDGVCLTDSVLTGSLLGRDVQVEGKAENLNLGDNAWMKK